MKSIFEKQNIFMEKMIADCGNGTLLEPIFKPYLDWHCHRTNRIECDKSEAYKMVETASARMEELVEKHPNAFDNLPTYINDDPWQGYEGMGEDKYIYSYYAFIEDEITNLILMGYISQENGR